MKFREGAWRWSSGVTPSCVKRVIEHHVEDDPRGGQTLVLAAVDRAGREGQDRFEGTALQIKISSPMPDVIRVQAIHHAPREAGVTRFDLDYSLKSNDVRIDERADELVFTSGKLALRLPKDKGWSMRFERDGQALTAGGWESLGYMRMAESGNFLAQRLSMSVGECVYGLGERFGPIVKNGQSVQIWNDDGGTASDLAYKNVPFYLSSAGYGLLVNSPGKVEFEIGTERVSQVQFAVPGEVLDYYVFAGDEPKEILEKYTKLSGRPAIPPAWSFGLWLTTSFTTHYNEKTVNEFVEGMAARGIPLQVFHFDCFWMTERHWCDFEWDRDAFPEPEAMLKRLRAKGLKICVWINPYISSLSKLFDEGRDKGYFIKRADGTVYQRDKWQPGMALVDFTNPAACEWYNAKLGALLEMGVDTFKTDFGEVIPDEGVVYHDGSDPKLMHNYYAYLYNLTVFGLLEEKFGKNNAMVFARSASAGSQKFPVHWGGDCEATFESMAEDLRGGLSFCTSGAAFWSHDIGGFTGTASPQLYKRWVAFGLLSTHSRLHGDGSYRVPWLFDEESVEVMRHFTRLKNRLFPYLFAAAHDARERGWPVMRAMHVEFPNDPACRYLDRQYMLGSSLLVAPVFREDDVAEYYLPEGRWTHLLSGEVVEGGKWRSEKQGFMRVPLFVRANSIVPISRDEQHPQWRLRDPLTLRLFEVADGATVQIRVASSDPSEEARAEFTAKRRGSSITLTSNGRAKKVSVALGAIAAPVDWADLSKPFVIEVGA